MSSHEIVKHANRIERLGIADPHDTEFWTSIETEPNGQHALVLGDLDDAIVIMGTPEQLAHVSHVIAARVADLQPQPEPAARPNGQIGLDI